MQDENLTIAITADTSGFSDALSVLEKQANRFGDTLSGSLKGAIASGRSLEDTLRGVAASLAGSLFDAGLKPLTSLLNGIGGSVLGSLGGVLPFAKGAAFQAGSVVSSPSYFPMSGRIGMMGEAGPEAVMPLTRGSNGALGVAMQGGAAPVVNVTIQANDPGAFRKSEGQISGAITRAVLRGQRMN